MNKHEVRTPEQALAYITDCNLATVCDMATKKSRAKSEFERQIGIAQSAVDWMRTMGVDVSGTRAEDIDRHCSVKLWAQQFMPEHEE